jgi:hypothetical protein
VFPIAEIYAGALFWPIERAAEILNAGGHGSKRCPTHANRWDACSSCRTSRSCPKGFRGRSFVLVEAAVIGKRERWRHAAAALRDLGPEMDTIAMMPEAS